MLLLLFTVSVAAQPGWRSSRSGTSADLVAVYFTSTDRGWIAGDNGYLASTVDGGRSWSTVPLGTSEDINEIYFRNEANGYVVAGRKLFVTSDGGQSWRQTVIFRSGDFPTGVPEFLSIRFADKKRGLVVGSVIGKNDVVVDSLVMRTNDGGETWQRVIVPVKTELFHLDFDGNSNAWIVGASGTILASQDGGVSWHSQRSGVTRALFNVDFRDDSYGFAVGGGGTVLRTEDSGATWEKVPVRTSETFKRVGFSDDKNGWIVGHGGSILRSSDRGRTWVMQESGTQARLYGLFVSKKYGWAVGEKGLILQYER
ncbi:MAG: YCF48-related protein [Pyrinomonadaceae bacterium]